MRSLAVAAALLLWIALASLLEAAPTAGASGRAAVGPAGRRAVSRYTELEERPRFEEGLNFEGGGRFVHQFESTGSKDSSIAVRRASFSTLLVYKRDDPPPFPLGIAARQDRYSLEGTGPFAGAWKTVNSAQLSLPVIAPLSERWQFVGLAYVGGSAEEGADLFDGLSWGVVATVTYKVNERFRIGPGIGVFRQLEEDFAVLPLASMKFDITPKWSIGFGGEGEGAGLALTHTPNESLSLSVAGAFDLLRFRRKDGSVGQDSGADILAKVTIRPMEGLSIQLSAGARIFGVLRRENERGVLIEDEAYDPAALIGFKLDFGGTSRGRPRGARGLRARQ